MFKKKSSTGEKKRKHSQSEERHDSGKRRSAGSSLEVRLRSCCRANLRSSGDELADPELDKIGSDIEEGGLDLSLTFQPITAYVGDKREMLEQCFHVLGEKKLRKMLPDELKECSLEEIKTLCWEQLESISEKNLIQILAGKTEAKGGGSGEESDVLSINADTYDSDIEGPKEEQTVKAADVAVKEGDGGEQCSDPAADPEPANPEPKKDIQSDIDKSVSEILAFSSASSKDAAKEQSAPLQSADGAGPVSSGSLAVCKPSIQQLELLELEMRARAIKALMKASNGKKASVLKNS
uniref:Caspase activity and apoptosis inhibitor 1 n=1 Tax=Amphilophus citrinellus TaxID=61819 RepID=A0A3Q0RVU6_AMPCI